MKAPSSIQTARLQLRKSVLVAMLCIAAILVVHAQAFNLQKMGPDVTVQVRAETTGEATISAWSANRDAEFAPGLAGVVHCQGGVKPDPYGTIALRCLNALPRNGLALEGVVDLAPIARKLQPSGAIQLYVNTPRLGFATTSIPMRNVGAGMRAARIVRFEADAIPLPIQIRFGFLPGQLAATLLPLVALALTLTLIAFLLGHAGLAGLSRSLILLGTIVWMSAASSLQVGALIHILLFSNSLATPAALCIEFWPPLLCVAIGAAWGSALRPGRRTTGEFGQIFWGFSVIPLILTCVIGALPLMMMKDWPHTAAWLAATPIVVLLRRAWVRSTAGARVQQLTTGELKDRISALAAQVGRPKIGALISFSARPQIAAAFALPGKIVYLTAPLVRSLSKREVDAVAAHELSHFSHSQRGQWISLAIAMVLFETPVKEVFLSSTTALLVATAVPVAVLFGALAVARQREFAADANAAALTGDPRAMIGSLARVARINNSSLDMNPVTEWISSHPSMRKRIRSLASAARLSTAEMESLCASGDPIDTYQIPEEPQETRTVFTPAWQTANAGIYGWTALLATSAFGVVISSLLHSFPGAGALALVGGVLLGCVLTKFLAAAVMAINYAGLGRKLAAKLGCGGKPMGLAIASEPRLYNGFRFADTGLLRFENGRLIYKSERTTIALNPTDVVDVTMIASSPSLWFRKQPLVRFRSPESSEVKAFILHPVDWFITQPRLLRSIQRWKATGASADAASIEGFSPVAGQPVRNLATVAGVARAFPIPGGITLLIAFLIFNGDWGYISYALAVTACAHIFLFLPAILYRPPAPSPEPAPAAAAD
ncbi:MAG: M48 family metalloprotease [Terracidiphilus sp.]|jgi:Zn-dependent protease with chaperone function